MALPLGGALAPQRAACSGCADRCPPQRRSGSAGLLERSQDRTAEFGYPNRRGRFTPLSLPCRDGRIHTSNEKRTKVNELQANYRAITAACKWNLELVGNGYGCDDAGQFQEIVAEMVAIAIANPDFDVEQIIEFYELHMDEAG